MKSCFEEQFEQEKPVATAPTSVTAVRKTSTGNAVINLHNIPKMRVVLCEPRSSISDDVTDVQRPSSVNACTQTEEGWSSSGSGDYTPEGSSDSVPLALRYVPGHPLSPAAEYCVMCLQCYDSMCVIV